MIRLSPRRAIPRTLRSRKVTNLKRKIAQKIQNGQKVNSQDFERYWLAPDVRETLYQHHNGKCCYCERKRDLKRESDVEHFRPKAGIAEDGTHPGYWWLAYDWTNYLFACKPCNQTIKGNHFPLLPGARRALGPNDSIHDEKPLLVNPIDDDPAPCIGFEWQSTEDALVIAFGLDPEGRGAKTIELTDLNRPSLMEERAALILTLRGIAIKMSAAKYLGIQILINEAADEIRRETAASNSFTGFRRVFFRQMGYYNYVSNE